MCFWLLFCLTHNISLSLSLSLNRWCQLPLKEVRAVTHRSITHKMQMELQLQQMCLHKQKVGHLLLGH